MKVLVTGATGFLGSHIVKQLLRENHEIIILKRSFSDLWRIADAMEHVASYDLDKMNNLQSLFQEQGHIDAVIHTATCYGRKNESLSRIYETNFLFPLKLLEAAAFFNTATFFNTDTSLYKYLNNYSLSKKHFLEVGKNFADVGKINFINMKLEHIYGPQDDESKFVTYIIKSCLANIPELKLTKGEQKRDFIYIDDVVNAYTVLLHHAIDEKRKFQEFEIGTGQAITIKELVEKIHSLTHSSTNLNFGALPYRENEIMESKAGNGTLIEAGWIVNSLLEKNLTKCIGDVKSEITN